MNSYLILADIFLLALVFITLPTVISYRKLKEKIDKDPINVEFKYLEFDVLEDNSFMLDLGVSISPKFFGDNIGKLNHPFIKLYVDSRSIPAREIAFEHTSISSFSYDKKNHLFKANVTITMYCDSERIIKSKKFIMEQLKNGKISLGFKYKGKDIIYTIGISKILDTSNFYEEEFNNMVTNIHTTKAWL